MCKTCQWNNMTKCNTCYPGNNTNVYPTGAICCKISEIIMFKANYVYNGDEEYPECYWLNKKSKCLLCNDGNYMIQLNGPWYASTDYSYYCSSCKTLKSS